jgi:hypothetical protein
MRPATSTSPSVTCQSLSCVPARREQKSGSSSISHPKLSNNSNEELDIAMVVADSVSWRDNASATTLVAPGLYSTWKSNPSNLLAHWCCGIVDKHWSSKNLSYSGQSWSRMRTPTGKASNGESHGPGRWACARRPPASRGTRWWACWRRPLAPCPGVGRCQNQSLTCRTPPRRACRSQAAAGPVLWWAHAEWRGRCPLPLDTIRNLPSKAAWSRASWSCRSRRWTYGSSEAQEWAHGTHGTRCGPV